MSSRTTKKTVAQLRAETKQREDDFNLGRQLAKEVYAFYDLDAVPEGVQREDILNPFVDKASRACDLLQHHAQTDAGFDSYSFVMRTKAKLHNILEQHTGHCHLAASGRGLSCDGGQAGFQGGRARGEEWRSSILDECQLLLNSHQLEAATGRVRRQTTLTV